MRYCGGQGNLSPCRSEHSAMQLEIKATAQLNDDEAGALKALSAAVYPPKPDAAKNASPIKWARPQWSILLRDVDSQLVSYVGALTRLGLCDNQEILIGGIGGVKTHPGAARQRVCQGRDPASDRFPAPRAGRRFLAAGLPRRSADLLSAPWLERLCRGYPGAAERTKVDIHLERSHGHLRWEGAAVLPGFGFMRPALVIAAIMR